VNQAATTLTRAEGEEALADDILARRTPNLDVIIEHPTVVAFNA